MLNLLQVGVLHPQKGQEISIGVISRLIKNGIEARLTLIGDGEDLDRLKKISERLKVIDKIQFEGYKPNTKLEKYYKNCDLVLLPSINETFSAVPLEALKYGKISVVSNDSGNSEILSDFCIFTGRNVNDFYIAVIAYSKDRPEYINKAKLGYEFIRNNLTWDKYAQKFVDLFKEDVPSTVYDQKYFEVHHNNPKTRDLYNERQTRIERGIDFLEIKKDQKILDLGSGNGEVSEKIVDKGARVWGIDYSLEAVNLSKGLKLSNAKFEVGRISSLPYKNDFFDSIICLDVFEHVYPSELKKALKEIKRVLKPGGKLVVATAPNAFYLFPAEFIAKLFMGIKRFESDEYHINIFNYFSFKKLFDKYKGTKFITLTNDGHNYFSSRIAKSKKIPDYIKVSAKILDLFFENKISEYIILNSPLKILFAHDLWAVIQLEKNGKRDKSY